MPTGATPKSTRFSKCVHIICIKSMVVAVVHVGRSVNCCAFHGYCRLEQFNAPMCFRIQGVEIKKLSHLSRGLATI